MTELLPCPGYEGRYSVSDSGMVYSHRDGITREMASAPNKRGYRHLSLGGESYLVHRRAT